MATVPEIASDVAATVSGKARVITMAPKSAKRRVPLPTPSFVSFQSRRVAPPVAAAVPGGTKARARLTDRVEIRLVDLTSFVVGFRLPLPLLSNGPDRNATSTPASARARPWCPWSVHWLVEASASPMVPIQPSSLRHMHVRRLRRHGPNQPKGVTTGPWAVCQAASSSSMRLIR